MNLLCDEGVDRQIVEELRRAGHAVLYVAEMEPGVDDPTVLRHANEHGALLVTEDKDFGELVYRQNSIHRGVVLVRLAGVSSPGKARAVCAAFAQHGAEMAHAFTVLSPGRLRIRRQR